MAELFVSVVIFSAIVGIVKLLLDHRIQNKLIDKGLLDENVKYLYPRRFDYHVPSSLKWGMVLIGVGAAFIVGQLVPSRIHEEVTIGSVFLMAGIGLVAYYFIAGRLEKKMEEKGK